MMRLQQSFSSMVLNLSIMKKEMEFYYPEIPTATIHVTGTPQFEFYDDPHNIIEKETFFKKY